MAQPVIQHAFHAGEWAPELNARVDLQKYHSAAGLLRNFFVDYRGGASSCPGTKYVLAGYKPGSPIRLVPFAASFTVNYVLEFGDHYVRFYNNGAPVLENAIAASASSGNQITVTTSFNPGDWVFFQGSYFIVTANSGTALTVTDLFGNSPSLAGTGNVQRVYTLNSPYAASDLFPSGSNPGIKFAQNVNTLVICHPSYVPYVLTIVSATNWTLVPIVFGSTIPAPTASIATTGVGTLNVSYVVTALDSNNQESASSNVVSTTVHTITAPDNQTVTPSWAAVSGATSYNVYRAAGSYAGVVPTGAAFGFVANVTGLSFADNIISGVFQNQADFALTPPIPQNPFQGGSVVSTTVTNPGSYSGAVPIPTVTFAAAPAGGVTATGRPVMGALSATVSASGAGFSLGEVLRPNPSTLYGGITFKVASLSGSNVATVSVNNPGSIVGTGTNSTPSNPIAFFDQAGHQVNLTVTWGVKSITTIFGGVGYTTAPAITFSSGAAAATAVLGDLSAGNPSVPAFFQQRLVLAAPPGAVQTFYMSQPGSYYNFNISEPLQPDDAITASIVSLQLGTIKSMTPMPAGLVIFSDRGAWLVNGGGGSANFGAPVSATSTFAFAQAYNGSSDIPPIVVNYDILYNQAKQSYVRDLTFNFYVQIYTGTDISVLSSHLFYGHTLTNWAYAEEPFKMVWAVRDDGILLSLTYLKEQEVIGWAHRDTNGLFKSVASVVESVTLSNGLVMNVDAIYCVVQRTIQGQTVQYIERMAERIFPNGASDAWCVDAGIQYRGGPSSSFSGGQHLGGQTVTGLADGVVIPPFTMPASGSFSLGTPASVVTVGLAFTPQLQTLRLDLGEPTVQGKRKKITGVTLRVKDTLGLSIGRNFNSLVPMKDLVVGNVGTQSNQVVSGLVTDDVRTVIDPLWDVPGQFCIQQSSPLPASILGVIPEIAIGDTPR